VSPAAILEEYIQKKEAAGGFPAASFFCPRSPLLELCEKGGMGE